MNSVEKAVYVIQTAGNLLPPMLTDYSNNTMNTVSAEQVPMALFGFFNISDYQTLLAKKFIGAALAYLTFDAVSVTKEFMLKLLEDDSK